MEQALADLASGQGAERRFEFRIKHADGTWRTMEAIGRNLLDDPAVGGIVINHRDVTERKVLEAQLTRQAFHDALTGLPNRALFTDRVSHALKRRGRQHRGVVVLFVDLDDFKAINDSLGHQAGDRVLQEVGERLRTTVRPGDTVARLGGDEFAFLLEDVSDPADADEVAERVADRRWARRWPSAASRWRCGRASASRSREDGDTAADLLRDADTAMYTAKARGGGSHERFVPAMREAAITPLRARAPTCGARSSAGSSSSTTSRSSTCAWAGSSASRRSSAGSTRRAGCCRRPGSSPPAEATGLIVPIGRWVLEEACRQARAWQLATLTEPPLTMSANLSRPRAPRARAGRGRRRRSCSGRASTRPRWCSRSPRPAWSRTRTARSRRSQALKALGVRLAIDDFGTGYSSLSYLRRLPVDVLKLDRSFVVPSGRGDRESALVDAVFRLGRSLGLVTIAEGIEDAEQRDRLISLGCRVGPGLPVRATDGRARGASSSSSRYRQAAPMRRARPTAGIERGRLTHGAAPDRIEGKRRTPGWSGPGVQVEAVLVAGRGFEPLTFGL